MEILTTTPVYGMFPNVAIGILIFISFLVAAIFTGLFIEDVVCCDGLNTKHMKKCVIGFDLLFIILLFTNIFVWKEDRLTGYNYECIISDEITFNEMIPRYEVVGVEGKIVTLYESVK